MEEFDNTKFNEEIADRVDRFLRKEMTEDEAKTFVEEVKSNSELKEYYQRQFNLMRGINFEQMTVSMKKMERRHKITRKTTKILAPLAVAASLIFGVFIWDGIVTTNVGHNMYAQTILRGGDEIDELVNQKKYQEAIDEINKQLSIPYIEDDTSAIAAYTQTMNNLKYKKALIYLQMGKKKEAKAILKELDDERSNQVLKKLLW